MTQTFRRVITPPVIARVGLTAIAMVLAVSLIQQQRRDAANGDQTAKPLIALSTAPYNESEVRDLDIELYDRRIREDPSSALDRFTLARLLFTRARLPFTSARLICTSVRLLCTHTRLPCTSPPVVCTDPPVIWTSPSLLCIDAAVPSTAATVPSPAAQINDTNPEGR